MRRRVVVKVVPVPPGESPDWLSRLLANVRKAAAIDHPNLVKALDAGVCRGVGAGHHDRHFFVREHLAGATIQQRVAVEPLSLREACAALFQIASALDETHRHSLVHGGIRSSSVFITNEGAAKLLDFGLVVPIVRDEFTAPECAEDPTAADIRADIHGLAATFVFAIGGKQGVAASSLDLPPGLKDVVRRSLDPNPAECPATPQMWMQALLPILEEHAKSEASRRPIARGAEWRAPQHGSGRPPRALIVNAEARQRAALTSVLKPAGIECSELTSADDALQHLRANPVDAILLSADFANDAGRAALRNLRDNPPGTNLKIFVTSAHGGDDDLASFLAAGADDFLGLPFSDVQLCARVKAAIKHKDAEDLTERLSRQFLDLNVELERDLDARTADLVQARNSLVLALARLVEYRSTETVAHLMRMQRYVAALAQEASGMAKFAEHIDAPFIQALECCAPLHDIGNVGLPDAILIKAGRLEPEERAVMQQHTIIGADTLQQVAQRIGPDAGFLRMAIDIARHHHEHYDGSGYPDALAGDAIPLAARLLAIADAYDALRSRRAQRPALAHAAALQVMLEASPGRFDPYLLVAFQQRADQFERIFRELPDSLMWE
jgi:putative two-component system response regulator